MQKAQEILLDKRIRKDYDRFNRPSFSAVPESDRREKQLLPVNEESFLRCIQEDAAKSPQWFENFFTLVSKQPTEIQRGIWKLIHAGWLTYGDLETAIVDRDYHPSWVNVCKRPYLWEIILSKPAVIDFVINELSQTQHILPKPYSYWEDSPLLAICTLYEFKPGRRFCQEINWLNRSYGDISSVDVPLNKDEEFLLYLLRQNDNGQRCISFVPNPHGVGLRGPKSFLLNQHNATCMIQDVRAYLTEPPEMSFEDLRKRLSTRESIVYWDELYAIDHVNKHVYLPLHGQMTALKEADLLAPSKQRRLEQMFESIENVLRRVTDEWVALSLEEPAAFARLKTLMGEQICSGKPNLELPELEFLKEIEGLRSQLGQELITEETEIEREERLEAIREREAARQKYEAKTEPVAKPVPPQSRLGRFGLFCHAHPVPMAVTGVATVAALGLGAMALYQYLNNASVYDWLTDSLGIGTPADMAVMLASVVLLLAIIASIVVHRMANGRQDAVPAAPIAQEAVPPAMEEDQREAEAFAV